MLAHRAPIGYRVAHQTIPSSDWLSLVALFTFPRKPRGGRFAPPLRPHPPQCGAAPVWGSKTGLGVGRTPPSLRSQGRTPLPPPPAVLPPPERSPSDPTDGVRDGGGHPQPIGLGGTADTVGALSTVGTQHCSPSPWVKPPGHPPPTHSNGALWAAEPTPTPPLGFYRPWGGHKTPPTGGPHTELPTAPKHGGGQEGGTQQQTWSSMLMLMQAGLLSNMDQDLSLRAVVSLQQKESMSSGPKTSHFRFAGQTALFSLHSAPQEALQSQQAAFISYTPHRQGHLPWISCVLFWKSLIMA